MARQRFDIASKWLLQHQGTSTLRIGGLASVSRTAPMPGEVVQNQRFPDGLLQAFLGDDPKPRHVLVEIATYPERRALRQALDDLTLAYSALGHLPELLMLVLRPKGKFRIEGRHEIRSELGLSRMEVEWRTVELWALSADDYLTGPDVGAMPWVPLMGIDGPPEPVLERCAERINREAPVPARTEMLVIAEVMAGLRFPHLNLMALFGERKAMIESPVIQRWKAEAVHEVILDTLKRRFGATPRDITRPLRKIVDAKKLRQLNLIAVDCTDIDAFRAALPE